MRSLEKNNLKFLGQNVNGRKLNYYECKAVCVQSPVITGKIKVSCLNGIVG